MQFTIERSYFLDKLALVSRAISAHSPMPILTGVLIQVKEDQIILTGSSNDFVIQTPIFPDELSGLVIEQPGSMAVNARIIQELLRKMSAGRVTISTLDETIMRVSDKDGKFDLVGFPGHEYSPVSLEQPDQHIVLPAILLQDIADQISYACAEKDSRQVLMGINLQLKDGQLAATATDSYRLARKVVPLASEESFSITIPVGPFKETVRSFEGVQDVDVYLNRKKVQFVFGHTLIQTQLYEGTYPDAVRIIPTRFISTLKAKSRDIEGMLDRSAVYTSSTSTSGTIIPVRMDFTADAVGLQVLTSDIGSCRQTLDDTVYEGDDLAISFNAKLMLDALRGLKAQDEIEMGFTGELRPIRITNPQDESLVMIVVPIRSA